jgi:hypothetical protein
MPVPQGLSSSLIVELKMVLEASNQFNDDELKEIYLLGSTAAHKSAKLSLLQNVLPKLGNILISRSAEDKDREAQRRQEARDSGLARKAQEAKALGTLSEALNKAKSARKTRSMTAKEKPISDSQNTGPELVQALSSLESLPSARPVTPPSQIRSASGGSYGPRSTETTPQKLEKAESDIQDLLAYMVSDLIRGTYGNPYVPLPWVRGRTMALQFSK